jgi:hypothetical protein
MSNTSSETTHIAKTTSIKGEVRLEGPATIAGKVEGNIHGKEVEIVQDATVEGDIACGTIELNGNVKGNVTRRPGVRGHIRRCEDRIDRSQCRQPHRSGLGRQQQHRRHRRGLEQRAEHSQPPEGAGVSVRHRRRSLRDFPEWTVEAQTATGSPPAYA